MHSYRRFDFCTFAIRFLFVCLFEEEGCKQGMSRRASEFEEAKVFKNRLAGNRRAHRQCDQIAPVSFSALFFDRDPTFPVSECFPFYPQEKKSPRSGHSRRKKTNVTNPGKEQRERKEKMNENGGFGGGLAGRRVEL